MDRDFAGYARTAGVLLIVTFAAGGFGEAFAPSQIFVSGDPATTADHIRSLNGLFRWGFAAYLVEAFCDTALSVLFYLLLKPAGRGLALTAAFLGLISTTLFAVTEMFDFALPAILVRGGPTLAAFTPEQLDALAHLSLRFGAVSANVFMIVYGVAWLIRGGLFLRSAAIPRPIGALLLLTGAGFSVQALGAIFAVPTPGVTYAMMPGLIVLALWLTLRGVDAARLAGGGWAARPVEAHAAPEAA